MSSIKTEGNKTVSVTNIETGQTYKKTPQEAAIIKANPLTANLYRFENTEDLPELGSKIPKASTGN